MALEHTRINPVYPLIWESMDTLRIGFDSAEVQIVDPSAAAQRLITRLQRGIITNTLAEVAAETGCTPAERDHIQYACSNVFITELREPPKPIHHSPVTRSKKKSPHKREASNNTPKAFTTADTLVAVLGSRTTRSRVLRSFEFRGFRAHRATTLKELSETQDSPPALVILAERFWATPHMFQQLVILGLPHLVIRFTDQSVRIGPIIFPNQTACGVCMQLIDTEANPVIPILAAQLLRIVPATETPIVTDFAAVVASHLWHAHNSVQGLEKESFNVAVQYPVVQGHPTHVPSTLTYTKHPECGCALSFAAEVEKRRTPVEPAVTTYYPPSMRRR